MSAVRWMMAAVVGVGMTVAVSAHEGHSHTVMGTIAKVTATQLEVTTQDGKAETIVLNDKTVVTMGKMTKKLADLSAGQRVVVDVGEGKAPLTAKGIKLGMMAGMAGKMGQKAAPKPRVDPHADHDDKAAGEHDHGAEGAEPGKKGCCDAGTPGKKGCCEK